MMDGKKNGLGDDGYLYGSGEKAGLHREDQLICEYKNGCRHGKATEDTVDENGNKQLFNILYHYGSEHQRFDITKTPELAFYIGEKPNLALAKDWMIGLGVKHHTKARNEPKPTK